MPAPVTIKTANTVNTVNTSAFMPLCRQISMTALYGLLILIVPQALLAQTFTTPGDDRSNALPGTAEPVALPQLFASMTVDRSEIYIGEQLNVTMEVLSPASAFNIRKQKLQIASADIHTLEKHTVDTSRDSIPYRLETIRHAIYFKEPGLYTIPALKVTATLPVSAGGTNADSNPKISVQSTEQLITVNQAPVTANQWLPASKLTIDANWTSAGEALQFVAGQPVSRQYVFNVTGQFPTAIPAVNFTFPSGIRHYQNPPQFEKHSDKSGVRGSLIQVVNLIPEQAGEYTLPSLAVNWWDTTNRRWQTATVAEESISVHPGQYGRSDGSHTLYYTLIGLLAALSVALSGLCFYLWQRLRQTLSTPVPVTTEKQAWKALDQALKSTSNVKTKRDLTLREAMEVRRALTAWHAAVNPSAPTNRIDQMATNDAAISTNLQRLEASLFRHTDDNQCGQPHDLTDDQSSDRQPDFKQLRKQLKSYRRSLILTTHTQTATDSSRQMSLYPSRSVD
jgi:hypothetical protein